VHTLTPTRAGLLLKSGITTAGAIEVIVSDQAGLPVPGAWTM
jgi:hypothetical protein